MDLNFGTISFIICGIIYFVLTAILFLNQKRYKHPFTQSMLYATSVMVVWSIVSVINTQTQSHSIPLIITNINEVLRFFVWFLVFLTIIKEATGTYSKRKHNSLYFRLTLISAIACAITVFIPIFALGVNWFFTDIPTNRFIYIGHLSLCIVGLIHIEQLIRNARNISFNQIKFFSLAVGAVFAYDFFMYADALNHNKISSNLYDMRGIINGFSAFIIASIIIKPTNLQVNIKLSRQLVFHSGVLIGCGIYLIVMSAVGYYINFLGGSWGSALQIFFLFSALFLLVILVFSERIQNKFRVFLNRHLFNYKYDYRDEWLQISNYLSASNAELPLQDRSVRAVASVINAKGGALWLKDSHDSYEPISTFHMPIEALKSYTRSCDFIQFLDEKHWIIEMDEYNESPHVYDNIHVAESLLHIPSAWLIIPLIFNEKLMGFILLLESPANINIDWEDRDILKTAARQTATHLAQMQSANALIEARQFATFNKMSAFIVHDLKTMIAQLSLLMTNASKHKSNPVFIDDMLGTIEHSVSKMYNLLSQLRQGNQNLNIEVFDVAELLSDLITDYAQRTPKPQFVAGPFPLFIKANAQQFRSIVGHLIQNALDASSKTGKIHVFVTKKDNTAVIEIKDTGIGMSDAYIKEKLFKPFESTKGLTGMGIGAYQAREYIKQIGGELSVKSKQQVGTVFTIKIAIAETTKPV